MRRRDLLGLITVCFGAGCVEGDVNNGLSQQADQSSEAPPTSIPSQTVESPTPGRSQTSEEDQTQRPTEKKPVSTETKETEEDSPLIAAVTRQLEKAVAAYVEQASEEWATILHVTAAADGFSAGAVHIETNRATSHIRRARNSQDGASQKIIEEYKLANQFLVNAAAVQDNLVEGHANLERAISFLDAEQYGPVDSFVSVSKSNTRSASRFVSTLRSQSNRASMRRIPSITPEIYDAKLAQFDAEIAAFEALQTAIKDFLNSLIAFQRELDKYPHSGADYAEFDSLHFDDAASTLDGAPRPASIGGALDSLECKANKYARASDKLDSGIDAMRKGNDRLWKDREAAAFDILNSIDEC